MKDIIAPKIIRQTFVLLLILLIGFLIFKEMMPYLSGVLGAITIYVLLRRWMVTLINKKWNPDFAAIFLMLISFVCILLPVTGLLMMLGNKIGDAVTNSEQVTQALKDLFGKIESRSGFDLAEKINVSEVSVWVTDNLKFCRWYF